MRMTGDAHHTLVEEHHTYGFRDDRIHFARSQDFRLYPLILHHPLDDPDFVLHMWVLLTLVGFPY